MKEKQFPEQQELPPVSVARLKLKELTEIASALHNVSLLISAEAARTTEVSQDTKEKFRIASQYVASYMPLLRSALEDPSLRLEALRVCGVLLSVRGFELRAAERIADTAHLVEGDCVRYPRHARLILGTLLEAHNALIGDGTNEAKVSRSAQKIQSSLERAHPKLKQLLAPEEEETARELSGVLHLLAGLLKAVRPEHAHWILDSLGERLAKLVTSDDYMPSFTIEAFKKAMQDVGEEERRVVPDNVITKAELHLRFGQISEARPTYLLSVFERLFKNLGLPPRLYFMLGNPKDVPEEEIKERHPIVKAVNLLEVFQALETKRPGILKELYTRFGIRRFDRYDPRTLIEQYDRRDSAERPYVVLLTATYDHNDAFENQSRDFYKTVAQELDALGFDFRIVECSSKQEFYERLDALDSAYGSSHKMSALIVQAHSSKEGIQLGGHDNAKGSVVVKDISDPSFARYKDHFVPNPTIILFGCSVGRKRGFAQVWSGVVNGTVKTAKGLDSMLLGLDMKKESGELVLTPEFLIDPKLGDSKPRTYVNGRQR